MKISSSGARVSLVSSTEDAIDLLSRSNLDAVDFWMYLCSLNEQSPLWQADWENWVMGIKARLDEAKLPALQSHALFNIFIPEDFSYVAPEPIMYRNIKASRMLDCEKLIFHPVAYRSTVTSRAQHQQILEYNLRWFEELLPTAEEQHVQLHIENVFDFADAQTHEPIPFAFTTMEDICWLVDRIDHPLFKTCFDTGHANICGHDVPACIRQLGKRLGSLHLNDNFGAIQPIYADLHLFPGHGALDWRDILSALRDVEFDGTLNMEPVDSIPRLPRELIIHEMSAAAEFLRKLAKLTGFAQ